MILHYSTTVVAHNSHQKSLRVLSPMFITIEKGGIMCTCPYQWKLRCEKKGGTQEYEKYSLVSFQICL